MKLNATISQPKKSKGPFIQNGKRESFVQTKPLEKDKIKRSQGQETKAEEFTKKASVNESILTAFSSHNPFQSSSASKLEPSISNGHPLPKPILKAFQKEFNEDFSQVIVHSDAASTQFTKDQNAAALAAGNHVFLNGNALDSDPVRSIYLLAHELYHTLNARSFNQSTAEIQLKPLSELSDRTPEQTNALNRAAKIAEGEQGKVDAGKLNPDQTRVGWEYLVEYFSTTLGEGVVVKEKSEYKAGKFLEENIKYLKRGKAQKVKKTAEGKFEVEVQDNVDLLPSWCGIFLFWALHKSGIHPPNWKFGQPNFTAKDQYKKGEYLPRVGDIVIKNGFNHYALVVKVSPETVADTKDLKNVKVTTMNGNTMGSNNLGGQIQEKTHDYSYWDYYINPFFKGVELTKEEDYKMDERLKSSTENTTAASSESASEKVDLTVGQYNASLKPVAEIAPEAKKGEEEKGEEEQIATVDPKAIMAKDAAFKSLHGTLKKNSNKEAEHDTAENKAQEAQQSAVSPSNERASQAKANKVEALGTLPPPKQFNAADLKKSILDEVDKLIEQKKEEAKRTGDKPKIKDDEIKSVKEKNNENIQKEKKESIGDVEEASKQVPDESAVEERKSEEVKPEDSGKPEKISKTSNAVAKPIAEPRISLEKESGKIDDKMAENEIDETQLQESEEPKFTETLKEKKGSQQEAADLKQDYRSIEEEKLNKDKASAKYLISDKTEQIHAVRQGEFGNVDSVKDSTKKADEEKRQEVADHIESIYSASEKSVNDKLAALETTVNTEFDEKMKTANDHFKENINTGLDDEFTSEFISKHLDREDYNNRVKAVFEAQSVKYKRELSDLLDPLTQKIADTLNAITLEISVAKLAVDVFVKGLEPSLQEIGNKSALAVMEKFSSLEKSVEQKQEALTNGLATKYADGVSSLEAQFKEVMDSRKSWLERAYDAVVGVIMEILKLLSDLKKALEQAAEYASQIIKKPKAFFNNLVKGATIGFNNFVKNIGKHLLNGALEWVTGEMSSAGIVLPKQFDFKGILSIILQVLGISVEKVKEVAKKVIGPKYVAMLEKGVDIGKNVGGKIMTVFSIIKKEGIIGLWEFIKEQFQDLKEKLMEEARNFIIVKIVEIAVVKLVAMLIPGAGFISAIKSMIDFLITLFAKARAIVNIIMGIIATFGEILAGNVSKVSTMIEGILAKFLGMAITFLAAILGLGNVGKKMNEIIQKKIKDPIEKAITKMMEKLKMVMTKLRIFELLDKIDAGIEKGKDWVDKKKEAVKKKASDALNSVKGFLGSLFKKYKDPNGETHTLKFKGEALYRESVSKTLGNYLLETQSDINTITNADEKNKHLISIDKAFKIHDSIVVLIGKTVKKSGPQYTGADKGFSPNEGVQLRDYLAQIADILRTLPLKNQGNKIPSTQIKYDENAKDGLEATANIISLDSKISGSQPAGNNSPLTQKIIDIVLTKKTNHNLVRGHLINHELYGTGEGTKNLAPIPKKANSGMLKTFEKQAKGLVHSNKVISLVVMMEYGEPKDKQDSGKSLLKEKLPEGSEIPVSVHYDLQELKLKDEAITKKEEIDNAKNWVENTNGMSKLSGAIPINHDDFF